MGYDEIPSRVALLGLTVVGFLVRAYPHILLIPRWIIEEVYNYATVRDLVAYGATTQNGFYPILEHQLIYAVWLVTKIDPVTLCQYANPMIGALTVIPLYYILRFNLSNSKALLGCLLWSFSEVAFYRSAYFGSTETLGYLLSLTALAIYQRKGAIYALPVVIVSVFAHLLPTVFVAGVIGVDLFLKANVRIRGLIITVSLIGMIFFFSPFNPHQRLLQSLTLQNILGGIKLSNLSLYSIEEIALGVVIFYGFILVALLAVTEYLRPLPRSRLMDIMGFMALGVFIFSWVDYQPNIFAPPRLLFYFLVPSIYYAIRNTPYMIIYVICLISLISGVMGSPTMLFTKDTMTLEEYNFIESIDFPVRGVSEWWTDYPIRNSVTLLVKGIPTMAINDTLSQNLSYDFYNPEATMRPDTGFVYVLLTPRMEQSGLFLVYTGTRTTRLNKAISDIWASGENGWMLIREENGIKLYKRNVK